MNICYTFFFIIFRIILFIHQNASFKIFTIITKIVNVVPLKTNTKSLLNILFFCNYKFNNKPPKFDFNNAPLITKTSNSLFELPKPKIEETEKRKKMFPSAEAVPPPDTD